MGGEDWVSGVLGMRICEKRGGGVIKPMMVLMMMMMLMPMLIAVKSLLRLVLVRREDEIAKLSCEDEYGGWITTADPPYWCSIGRGRSQHAIQCLCTRSTQQCTPFSPLKLT